MKLREHPVLTALRAWPPIWIHSRTKPYRKLWGEPGIFTGSLYSNHTPQRLFLTMIFEGQRFMGCLVITDQMFCYAIHEILKAHEGKTVQQIGNLDIGELM